MADRVAKVLTNPSQVDQLGEHISPYCVSMVCKAFVEKKHGDSWPEKRDAEKYLEHEMRCGREHEGCHIIGRSSRRILPIACHTGSMRRVTTCWWQENRERSSVPIVGKHESLLPSSMREVK
jgi:hypothetical protein